MSEAGGLHRPTAASPVLAGVVCDSAAGPGKGTAGGVFGSRTPACCKSDCSLGRRVC